MSYIPFLIKSHGSITSSPQKNMHICVHALIYTTTNLDYVQFWRFLYSLKTIYNVFPSLGLQVKVPCALHWSIRPLRQKLCLLCHCTKHKASSTKPGTHRILIREHWIGCMAPSSGALFLVFLLSCPTPRKRCISLLGQWPLILKSSSNAWLLTGCVTSFQTIKCQVLIDL